MCVCVFGRYVFSDEQIKQLFEKYDLDSDGLLDYFDFINGVLGDEESSLSKTKRLDRAHGAAQAGGLGSPAGTYNKKSGMSHEEIMANEMLPQWPPPANAR